MMIKKKEIYAQVAETTGLKKRDVRLVTDALLAYLHEQLKAGEDIQCPPLGKISGVTQKPGTEKEKRVYRLSLTKEKPMADTVEAVEATAPDTSD